MHLIVGSEDVTSSTKNRKKQKDFNDKDFDLRIRFKQILQQNLLCSIHLRKLPWQWKNNHEWRCMSYSKMVIRYICCHVTLRDTSKPTYHSLPPLLPRSGLYLANLTRPKEPHPKVRTLGCTNFSPQPFWPKDQLEVGLVSSTYRAEAFAQFPSVDILMGWLLKPLILYNQPLWRVVKHVWIWIICVTKPLQRSL